jgi:hypothetical protein
MEQTKRRSTKRSRVMNQAPAKPEAQVEDEALFLGVFKRALRGDRPCDISQNSAEQTGEEMLEEDYQGFQELRKTEAYKAFISR